jgi:hypothetical protein
MQWRGMCAVAIVTGAVAWFGGRAFTDEGDKPQAPSPEEMAKWKELATPGEMHEWLARSEGTWDVAGKMWMGPEPIEFTGTATFEMILGGRWQQHTFDATIGEPFQGFGLTGYDNDKKQFMGYWFDTWSTAGSTPSIGQLSEDKKVLTMKGEWEMGNEKVQYRHVLTFTSDKETRFQAHHTQGGKESLVMDFTYTRK